MSKATRAAIYLRVSTDGQTTENQRLVLEAVAEQRGWQVVRLYEDAGISGAKGRDRRPGFDAAMKDATRRRFDVLMIWSVDRLGRSAAGVAALEDLCAAEVAIYADKEGVDATTPRGRAMLQRAMASICAKSSYIGWRGAFTPAQAPERRYCRLCRAQTRGRRRRAGSEPCTIPIRFAGVQPNVFSTLAEP